MGLVNAVVEYKLRSMCHSIGLSIFIVWVTYQGSLRMDRLEEISSLSKCLDAVYMLTCILFEITEM
jgi:hypothetical protein